MDGYYVRYRRDVAGSTRSLHQREILLGVRSGEFVITRPGRGSWTAAVGDPESWLLQLNNPAKAATTKKPATAPRAKTAAKTAPKATKAAPKAAKAPARRPAAAKAKP